MIWFCISEETGRTSIGQVGPRPFLIRQSWTHMGIVTALKGIVPRRLWPYLGATRRWLRTIPPQTQLQKRRLLSNPSLSDTQRELLSKVSTRIYYNDGMYHGDGVHYFKVGLRRSSALMRHSQAPAEGPANDPRSALRQRTRVEISAPAFSGGRASRRLNSRQDQ